MVLEADNKIDLVVEVELQHVLLHNMDKNQLHLCIDYECLTSNRPADLELKLVERWSSLLLSVTLQPIAPLYSEFVILPSQMDRIHVRTRKN